MMMSFAINISLNLLSMGDWVSARALKKRKLILNYEGENQFT